MGERTNRHAQPHATGHIQGNADGIVEMRPDDFFYEVLKENALGLADNDHASKAIQHMVGKAVPALARHGGGQMFVEESRTHQHAIAQEIAEAREPRVRPRVYAGLERKKPLYPFMLEASKHPTVQVVAMDIDRKNDPDMERAKMLEEPFFQSYQTKLDAFNAFLHPSKPPLEPNVNFMGGKAFGEAARQNPAIVERVLSARMRHNRPMADFMSEKVAQNPGRFAFFNGGLHMDNNEIYVNAAIDIDEMVAETTQANPATRGNVAHVAVYEYTYLPIHLRRPEATIMDNSKASCLCLEPDTKDHGEFSVFVPPVAAQRAAKLKLDTLTPQQQWALIRAVGEFQESLGCDTVKFLRTPTKHHPLSPTQQKAEDALYAISEAAVSLDFKKAAHVLRSQMSHGAFDLKSGKEEMKSTMALLRLKLDKLDAGMRHYAETGPALPSPSTPSASMPVPMMRRHRD